ISRGTEPSLNSRGIAPGFTRGKEIHTSTPASRADTLGKEDSHAPSQFRQISSTFAVVCGIRYRPGNRRKSIRAVHYSSCKRRRPFDRSWSLYQVGSHSVCERHRQSDSPLGYHWPKSLAWFTSLRRRYADHLQRLRLYRTG